MTTICSLLRDWSYFALNAGKTDSELVYLLKFRTGS